MIQTGFSNYSQAINTIVWTFEDLGYDDDLKAASNVKTAVEKLPTSMTLKWNEHLLHNKVSRPTLTVLAKGDGNHPTSRCPQFIALNPDNRAEKVKETKLCFWCLSPGHRSQNCPTPKECNTGGCKKRHHPLMHDTKRVYQTCGSKQHVGLTYQQASQVLLQILPVTIHGLVGLHRTYAMLDMGSAWTLIQASVANKVGLTGPTEQMILNGDGRKAEPSEDKHQHVEGEESLASLSEPVKDVDIMVLQGADVFDLIVPLEIRTGSKGTPRAVRTALGWTATSRLPGSSDINTVTAMKVHITTPEEDLTHQVQLWWKIESFGCKYVEETS
ncbi:Hypothetical predicted protein [Paramuricea clavata]|uniref:Uncharacterized protein n=1 Tax=Paramuricea clavata TaxID=317549 RepID=A0A6S7L4U9_PARCT|nr:Hypothetical predicted protein [Paramuricea clavata]